jgi:hypothetical protein
MLLTHLNEILCNLNFLVELLPFISHELGWACDSENTSLIFASFHIFGFVSKFNPFFPSLNDLRPTWIYSLYYFHLRGGSVSILIGGFNLLGQLFSCGLAHRHLVDDWLNIINN